jgi:hypothetical protein
LEHPLFESKRVSNVQPSISSLKSLLGQFFGGSVHETCTDFSVRFLLNENWNHIALNSLRQKTTPHISSQAYCTWSDLEHLFEQRLHNMPASCLTDCVRLINTCVLLQTSEVHAGNVLINLAKIARKRNCLNFAGRLLQSIQGQENSIQYEYEKAKLEFAKDNKGPAFELMLKLAQSLCVNDSINLDCMHSLNDRHQAKVFLRLAKWAQLGSFNDISTVITRYFDQNNFNDLATLQNEIPNLRFSRKLHNLATEKASQSALAWLKYAEFNYVYAVNLLSEEGSWREILLSRLQPAVDAIWEDKLPTVDAEKVYKLIGFPFLLLICEKYADST